MKETEGAETAIAAKFVHARRVHAQLEALRMLVLVGTASGSLTVACL